MEHRFLWQGKEFVVSLEQGPDGFLARVDGREHRIRRIPCEEGTLGLEVDGAIHRIPFAREGETVHLSSRGETYRLERADPLGRRRAPHHHEQPLEAPMPGLVRSVDVKAGDDVRRGQTLLVLEAMKMEIRITAPEPSRVVRIHCALGEQVERGQVLVDLDSDGGSSR